eukprot:1140902-Pelagomonas_calceolata.AAC.6
MHGVLGEQGPIALIICGAGGLFEGTACARALAVVVSGTWYMDSRAWHLEHGCVPLFSKAGAVHDAGSAGLTASVMLGQQG